MVLLNSGGANSASILEIVHHGGNIWNIWRDGIFFVNAEDISLDGIAIGGKVWGTDRLEFNLLRWQLVRGP